MEAMLFIKDQPCTGFHINREVIIHPSNFNFYLIRKCVLIKKNYVTIKFYEAEDLGFDCSF